MTLAVRYEVLVDWDMTDWAAVPDFTQDEDNISADVQSVGWGMGKETEAGNAPAGTFQVRMKPGPAIALKYSPFNAAGELYGRLVPWRVIRVRASNDGITWWPRFFGYISKYVLDVSPGSQSVSLYCTDGADLLARQKLSQDWDERETISEAAAMNRILDAGGWSQSRRSLDSGSNVQYPLTGEY